MENFLEKKCQYCDQELLITDGTHICPDCGASYHQACWEKNGGCTTPGCSNQPKPVENETAEPVSAADLDEETPAAAPAPQADPAGDALASPPKPNRFCESCGSPLSAEEKFCPRCGRPTEVLAAPVSQTAPNNISTPPLALGSSCAFCHAPLGAEEKFCPRCGRPAGMPVGVPFVPSNQKPKKNNKKVIIISVSIAAAVLILAAVAVAVGVVIVANNARAAEEARIAAIEEYVDDVEQFGYQILDSCAKLEDIGNEMQDCWYDYVYNHQTKYASPREAVDDAYDALSSDVADVKSAYPGFKTDYNLLMNTLPDQTDDLIEIQDAVEDLYEAYDDFYDCILNPTGNYSAFSSKFSDTDEAFLDKFENLEDLLSSYNADQSNW